MQELLKNAWLGWQQYIDSGKYAALLLVVLLFLWFRREEEKQKLLLIYSTLLTILCIFPVSAAVLMSYQTRFYDYEWIWNYVPVTLMIAYGETIFLSEYWECYKKNIWKCVGVTAAVVALVFLCGSMGQNVFDAETERRERAEAQAVFDSLLTEAGKTEICLWAPKEIMASARAYDGSLRLVYGRNMWDAALGAYSYETYGEQEEMLYQWMCDLEETGTTEATAFPAEAVRETGVNRILIPGNILPEDLEQMEQVLGAESGQLGDYYLLVIE